MAYVTAATSRTPALVLYLIDVSGSMNGELDGKPKIEHVNEAIEDILVQMVERSTKGSLISPRYRLAMAAYSDTPIDLLGGIQSIDQVASMGSPQLAATQTTDTAAAFRWAKALLERCLPELYGDPAPMICHLTDGHFTGDDPEPIAHEIMQMKNDDGHVLIENVYLGSNLTSARTPPVARWRGVCSPEELSDPYAKKLYNMSSALPQSYAGMMAEQGYALDPSARMLIPGTSRDLVKLAFAVSGATPVA